MRLKSPNNLRECGSDSAPNYNALIALDTNNRRAITKTTELLSSNCYLETSSLVLPRRGETGDKENPGKEQPTTPTTANATATTKQSSSNQ